MVRPRLLGLALASQLFQLVSCEPQITFPLNSQLPPVARIDELFSYVFSQYTFRSDSNITYSLGQHPEWLSLESDGRRLYGIPEDDSVAAGEVIGQTVEIVATDDTGSVTMNSTLVISRRTPPVISIPLSQQIEGFGKYSAPSSLLSYPSTSFTYTFDRDTFESANGVNYYATSGDSSPLPSWMSFDAETLTFSGITPSFESLVQPPQNFSFQLVASDIVGFSAEAIVFSLVVGSQKLTTDAPIVVLNATRGSKLTYDGLADGLSLDDKPVKPGSLRVEVQGLPDWLSFNNETWGIEGTPAKDERSSNFSIAFSDPLANTLDVLIVANVATGLFKSTFDDIEAEPGEEIDLDLSSHLRDPDDVEIGVTTTPKQDWLKVDGLKVHGLVPKSAKGTLKISIKARSKSSDLSETEGLNVSFLALDGSTTTTSRERKTSATSTVSETNDEADEADEDTDEGPGKLPTGIILLATLIPIFTIALIMLLCACLLRRRRKAKETYLNSTYRHKISHPVLETLVINGNDPNSGAKSEKGLPADTIVATTAFWDPKKILANNQTRASSMMSRSSGTVEMNPSLMMAAGGAMPPSLRTVSMPTTPGGESESRRSWITVEDGQGERSGGLRRQSETTVPDSIEHHVHFPGSKSDKTFRSGLDVAIPSLSDLSILPELMSPILETPQQQHHRPRDHDALSMASSGVLPSSVISSPFNLGTVIKRGLSTHNHLNSLNNTASFYNYTPRYSNRPSTAPADSDDPGRDTVAELKTPGAAATRNSWYAKRNSEIGTRSSTHTGSFHTDTSFGSSENWRVVGNTKSGTSGATGVGPTAAPGSPTYLELVEEAPYNPSRPGTSKGVEDKRESDPAVPALKRDDSAVGSIMAFL